MTYEVEFGFLLFNNFEEKWFATDKKVKNEFSCRKSEKLTSVFSFDFSSELGQKQFSHKK